MPKVTNQNPTMDDDFKQNIIKARSVVSAELARQGYNIDVRMLTTISLLTTAALRFFKEEITGEEARHSFNDAIAIYQNNNVPF